VLKIVGLSFISRAEKATKKSEILKAAKTKAAQ
jgi:hypothetical protein